jgi:hypothetical protein
MRSCISFIGGFMNFGQFVSKYVTYDNAKEYASVTDKIALVSDITGLSVDHRFIAPLEFMLDEYLGYGHEVVNYHQQTKVGTIPANFFL